MARGGVIQGVAETIETDNPAAEIHVSALNGSDETGNGSLGYPYQTVDAATRLADPGDTVYIHEGTYRETMVTRSDGVEGNAVTYKNYGNDTVTVSAFDSVSGWVQNADNPNVYSVMIGTDWQDLFDAGGNRLLIDGKPVMEAQWPNIPDPVEGLRQSMDLAARSDAGQMISMETKTGSYKDTDLSAVSGIDLVGATIHTEAGKAWWDQEFTVTAHDSKTNELQFDMSSVADSWFDGTAEPKADNTYHLTGKKAFLDQAGEWYFDQDNGELFIHLGPEDNPADMNIEVLARKQSLYAYDSHYVDVEGIRFIGGQVNIHDTSSNVHLGNVEVTLGSGHVNVYLAGQDNAFTDSHIHKFSGIAVGARGDGHIISNNIIHDATDQTSGIAANKDSSNMTIQNNTVFNMPSGGINIGSVASDFGYNHVYNGGIGRATDIALMNTISGGDRGGSEIHHNIVHDAMSRVDYNEQYWGMAGIRIDTGPSGLSIHHNLIWNTSKHQALIVRGVRPWEENYGDQDIQVYDNTVDGGVRTYKYIAGNGETTEGTTSDNNLILNGLDSNLSVGNTDFIADYRVTPGVADRDYNANGQSAGAYSDGDFVAGALTGNQVIQGSREADILFGGQGDDWLLGGAGDDYYTGFSAGAQGHDIILDEAGNDTLDLWNITLDDLAHVRWEAVDSNNDGVKDGLKIAQTGLSTLTIANYFAEDGGKGAGYIETIVTRADNAIGLSTVQSYLQTLIEGGNGDDILDGQNTASWLVGGLGDDVYLVDSISDVVIESANAGNDTIFSSIDVTMPHHVEHIILAGTNHVNATGSVFDDTLTSNMGDNIVDGHYGNDTYIFADGVNTVSFKAEQRGDGVSVNHFTLGSGDDTGVFSYRSDVIFGGAGNDDLNGRAGGDFIDGSAGDNRIRAWSGNDTYIFDRNFGVDILNNMSAESDQDILDFTVFRLEDVTFSRSYHNLIIEDDAGNKLTHQYYFEASGSALDDMAASAIHFDDGLIMHENSEPIQALRFAEEWA